MWFPRLPSDRALRVRPIDGPFALTLKQSNANRIYCLNNAAEEAGLARGMSLSDARAYCPALVTRPVDLPAEARFLAVLRRWATRYCPWVGIEEGGLVLDVTGAAHLLGGEEPLLADMQARLTRSGITVQLALADTRGAAWALARFAPGIAASGDHAALRRLPVEALRLDDSTVVEIGRAHV